MNRFVIVDGLPFLFSGGKTYSVRWDEKGFTVGAEVNVASVPTYTYSETSVKAKCQGRLDSITVIETAEAPAVETAEEAAVKPKVARKKKVNADDPDS